MLPKKNRLTDRGDFTGVFHGNIRVRSGPFFFICRKNDIHYNRFGFIVSRAVSKKAVTRNVLRRQLHEIVRSLSPRLMQGYDCVVRSYPGATGLHFGELNGRIVTMFEKAGIYHKDIIKNVNTKNKNDHAK